MIRSSASFRRMAWLALLAALLALAVPTASRVVATLVPKLAPVLMEMCTTAGREVIDVAPFIATEEPVRPAMSMTEACGYCVLATPLPLVLLLFCLLSPGPIRSQLAGVYLVFLRSARNMRGLGSQGPPCAF